VTFTNPKTAEKYRKLGFLSAGLSVKLTIGSVSVYASEHPFKGVLLIFEEFTGRRICQYESTLLEECGIEQIAGLIYLNVAHNFHHASEEFRNHFSNLGIPLPKDRELQTIQTSEQTVTRNRLILRSIGLMDSKYSVI
jgi:hypothetical protein